MRPALALPILCWLLTLQVADAARLEVGEYRQRIWGGETVSLTVRVKDAGQTEDMRIVWALVHGKAALLEGVGTVPESGEVRITLDTPEVRTRIATTLGLRLHAGEEVLARAEHHLQLFPRGAMDGLTELLGIRSVGLVDPHGRLNGMAERVRLRWVPLRSPLQVRRFDGPTAILAPGTVLALPATGLAVRSPLEQALLEKVENGMTLICLRQAEPALSLEELDRTLLETKVNGIRALDQDHAALRSLMPGDLQAFLSPEPVSVIPWPKGGNYRVILDVADAAQPVAVMLEVRRRKGRILFCQLPLVDELATKPLAELLLGDMLRWSLTKPATLKPVEMLLPEESDALRLLTELRIKTWEQTDSAADAVLLADAEAATNARKKALAMRLKDGGVVVLFGLGPDQIETMNELMLRRWERDLRAEAPELALQPFAPQERVRADAPLHPLLAGIRPEDIHALGQWEAGLDRDVYRVRPVRDLAHFQDLIGKGLLCKYERDDVRLMFWQVSLDMVEDEQALRRVLSCLLTNLGVR